MGGIDSLSENVLESHQNSSALRGSHPVEVLHITSCWFWLHFVNLIIALKFHLCKQQKGSCFELKLASNAYVLVLAGIEGGDDNRFYLFFVFWHTAFSVCNTLRFGRGQKSVIVEW